jgi:hypothetical protein
MTSVQSSIRAEVKRGEFPSPKGVEAFAAYAIASAKDLIPEMENAARLTLDHPMTFEVLGEELPLFTGWALRDLVSFRRRCRDNLVTCLDSFLQVQPPGPSSVWVGCSGSTRARNAHAYDDDDDWWNRQNQNRAQNQNRDLPVWLNELLSRYQNDLKLKKFTYSLDIHSRIRGEYFTALQNHRKCNFCLSVHMMNGSTFCAELENKFAQACNKVRHSFYILNAVPLTETHVFTSPRYAVIVAQTLVQLISVLGNGKASQ